MHKRNRIYKAVAVLILVLMASTANAAYKLNPFTGKMDYYEVGGSNGSIGFSNYSANQFNVNNTKHDKAAFTAYSAFEVSRNALALPKSGGTLSGDVDFSGKMAVNMAGDTGMTLPASPTMNQSFMHMPTGRMVAMTWNGTSWDSVTSYGSMTMYVDGVSGTDSADKGFGTGTDAFKTFQYAVNQIPGQYKGDVHVNLSGTTYTEDVDIRGKNATGSYKIYIYGTMTTLSSGTSSGSNTNLFPISAGAQAYTYFYDTTKTWTVNAYAKKLLKITGGLGAGQERIIKSNTATRLEVVGVWDTLPNATSTYAIQDWATTVTRSTSANTVQVMSGQKNIELRYLKIDNTGGSNASVYIVDSSCDIYSCWISNGMLVGAYYAAGSSGTVQSSLIDGTAYYGGFASTSTVNFFHNYATGINGALGYAQGGMMLSLPAVKGNYLLSGIQGGLFLYGNAYVNEFDNNWCYGGSYGIYASIASSARIADKNLIEGASADGVYTDSGVILFESATTLIRNNTGFGLKAVGRGSFIFNAVPTLTTNTAGAKLVGSIDKTAGTATLVGGTITVANKGIAATDIIIFNRIGNFATIGDITPTISAGVSFTLTSTSGSDTGIFNYQIVSP